MKKLICEIVTLLAAFGLCFWLSVFHVYADSVDENNAGSEPNTGSVVEETVHENNGIAVISDESGKQSDGVIVQNGTPAGVQNDVTNEQVEENKSFDGDLPEAAGPSSIPQQGSNDVEPSDSSNNVIYKPAEEPAGTELAGQEPGSDILPSDQNQLNDGSSSDTKNAEGKNDSRISAPIEPMKGAGSETLEEGEDDSIYDSLLMTAPAAMDQPLRRTLNTDPQNSTEPESKDLHQPDDLIEGVAYFAFGSNDIPVIYRYSDTYFEAGSMDGYNNDLAIITAVLSNTSSPGTCSSGTDDIPEDERAAKMLENESKNIQTILREIGFENISINEDYTIDGNPFTTGLICGMKKIALNGEEYTILALFPRSFGYHEEWANNGDVGIEGDMQGPLNATNNNILPFLRDYLKKNNISGNLKIWSGGASRGGGLAMLTSALMDDQISDGSIREFLEADVSLTPDDIYTYTFGSPNFGDKNKAYITDTETGEKTPNPKYSNIYNFAADYDLVRNLLTGDNWGISHYGTEKTLSTEEAEEKLKTFLDHFAAVQGTTPKELPKDGYIYLDEEGTSYTLRSIIRQHTWAEK